MSKFNLRKGAIFIHKETSKKITYGKKNSDGSLWCITHDHNFLTLTIEELERDYISATEFEKAAKERRRRQAW